MATKKHESETAVAAPVEQTKAPAPVKKEQTSEKLESLKKELIALQDAAGKLPSGSDERNNADIASYKKGKEIDAEKQSILIAEQAALVAEKRNARVKLADQLIDAVRGGNEEEIATAREIVVNELLTKFSAPAKTGSKPTGDKPAGTRGAASSAIRALIIPMFAAGSTGAEVRKSMIHDHGFNDGTANGVILAYEKEIGLK